MDLYGYFVSVILPMLCGSMIVAMLLPEPISNAITERRRKRREQERSMLVKLASLGVVECAWAQGSGFPWNWYVYTPYPERSQEEFSTNITIGRVCANKTDGSLEMQFDKSVEPMDPEVKERFMQMFYKKFPDWSKPNITRVWAMEEKEAEARKLDEYLQELSKKNCAEAAAQVTASQIRCPVCRSTAVRKIDGLEHVAFYEWLGIASPLIGKCYECKSCGHFW